MGVTILNKLYGTLPLFAHAPGIPENNPLWTDVVRYANQGKPQRFTQPAGVTFITWNSGLPNSFISQHKKTLGTFEKSMERVGLEYVVLGKGVGSGWVNTMKLTTTCDFLDHCGTEYVSGIDSADAVVVSLPLTDNTQGLVDARAIAAMQPDAVLMNVGRGAVIDEKALYDALMARQIGGAVIDTWYQYPTPTQAECAPSQFDFASLDNVLMTPHMSGWTSGTVRRRQETLADNIGRLSRGEALINVLRSPLT